MISVNDVRSFLKMAPIKGGERAATFHMLSFAAECGKEIEKMTQKDEDYITLLRERLTQAVDMLKLMAPSAPNVQGWIDAVTAECALVDGGDISPDFRGRLSSMIPVRKGAVKVSIKTSMLEGDPFPENLEMLWIEAEPADMLSIGGQLIRTARDPRAADRKYMQ